jgi:hypothetical protein
MVFRACQNAEGQATHNITRNLCRDRILRPAAVLSRQKKGHFRPVTGRDRTERLARILSR